MEARKPEPSRARYNYSFEPPGARRQARVAKLADALDLGSSAARRAGSTPASRIIRHHDSARRDEAAGHGRPRGRYSARPSGGAWQV